MGWGCVWRDNGCPNFIGFFPLFLRGRRQGKELEMRCTYNVLYVFFPLQPPLLVSGRQILLLLFLLVPFLLLHQLSLRDKHTKNGSRGRRQRTTTKLFQLDSSHQLPQRSKEAEEEVIVSSSSISISNHSLQPRFPPPPPPPLSPFGGRSKAASETASIS